MAAKVKIVKAYDNKWQVKLPAIQVALADDFYDAMMEMETNPYDAIDGFEYVLNLTDNQHIDAMLHLGHTYKAVGEEKKGNDLIYESHQLALAAFPKSFDVTKHELPWVIQENRSILKTFVAAGLHFVRIGDFVKALEKFEQTLKLNPNDNQGVRLLLPECFMHLGRYEDILNHPAIKDDSFSPDALYGRVYAYYKLGDQTRAKAALKKAKKEYPYIVEELLKDVHVFPKAEAESSNGIVQGGRQEAYLYWFRLKEFWCADPSLLDFIRIN